MPLVGSASVKKVKFEKKDLPAKTCFSVYVAEPRVRRPRRAGSVVYMVDNMIRVW